VIESLAPLNTPIQLGWIAARPGGDTDPVVGQTAYNTGGAPGL
jgi:hypothetical protein